MASAPETPKPRSRKEAEAMKKAAEAAKAREAAAAKAASLPGGADERTLNYTGPEFAPQFEMPRTAADIFSRCATEGSARLLEHAPVLARQDGYELSAAGILAGVLKWGLAADSAATSPSWLATWLGLDGSFVWGAGFDGRPVSETNGATVRLTLQAARLVQRAQEFAHRVQGRDVFEARHLIAAMVVPGDPLIDGTIISAAKSLFGHDIRGFAPELLRRLEGRGQEPGEKPEEWRRILSSVPEPAMQPDYAADRPDPKTPDALNIGPDVAAFAQLICLENARPPLSIGLFGDWGSGKTFFMERLKDKIARVTRIAREDGEAGRPSPFTPHVVQVRFNAWHYADANLWACLTAEFFDQLRAGGADAAPGAAYEKLVGKVADHVRSLEAEVGDKAQAADASARDVAAREKEVEAARAALVKAAQSHFLAHAGPALTKAFEDNRGQLKEIGRRLYKDDLAEDIETFTAAARKALTVPGKIVTVAKGLTVTVPAALATIAMLFVLAFVSLAGFADIDRTTTFLAVALARFGSLFGAAGAGAAALWRAYGFVRPILDGATAFSKDMIAEQKKLARELKEKEEALGKARKVAEAALRDLNRARDKLAPYAAEEGRRSQASLLRYFLYEDADTKEYDNHIGLVSRARRSFETLDQIVSRARAARAAHERVSARPPNAAAATEAERRQWDEDDALAKEHDPKLAVPDRIILYIDDLDRCTHAQVYEVLQAVHLLLAFELFVVVVGVDVRWVEESLASHFARDAQALAANGAGQLAAAFAAQGDVDKAMAALKRAGDEAGRASRQRAIAYLEKIFQVPFWLRPLSTKDGNAYGSYVGTLLATNRRGVALPVGQVPNIFMSILPEDEEGADAPLPLEPMTPLEENDALAQVILSDAEADFLMSPELGRLAGSSPRAVKRFINIYRLYRARLSGLELGRFTGEAGRAPDFPIVAAILAFETGAGAARLDAFRRLLADHPDDLAVNLESKLWSGEYGEALDDADVLFDALRAMDGSRGEPAKVEEWQALARELRRYSFHRYEDAGG